MHRFLPLPFIVCLLLSGCSEPEAPLLHLTMKRDDGTSSVLSVRVFRTGPITDSGDRGSDGAGVRQSVTIDKIADDGITLTVTLVGIPSAPAQESKEQIFVPYGPEGTVTDLKDGTLSARLVRNKEK